MPASTISFSIGMICSFISGDCAARQLRTSPALALGPTPSEGAEGTPTVVLHASNTTLVRDPGAAICQVFQTMPSTASSQELVSAVFPRCSLVSVFQRARSTTCAVLQFSFTSFLLASSGARLILWVRPIFRAQVAFLASVPANNVLARIRILILG